MKRSKSIIDGDKEQETQNLKEKETATKRRRIEIQIRNREKALKNPMPLTSLTNADPDPESDSNSDGNQEPVTEKLHDELAYQGSDEFHGSLVESEPEIGNGEAIDEERLGERRNRFLIPARRIQFNFMDLEEEEFLNLKKWRPEEINEPDCTVSLVSLSKWKTKKGSAATAACEIVEWMGLVERNELVVNDTVELWCFRVGQGKYCRLCFMF